jgi:hypothetical protein
MRSDRAHVVVAQDTLSRPPLGTTRQGVDDRPLAVQTHSDARAVGLRSKRVGSKQRKAILLSLGGTLAPVLVVAAQMSTTFRLRSTVFFIAAAVCAVIGPALGHAVLGRSVWSRGTRIRYAGALVFVASLVGFLVLGLARGPRDWGWGILAIGTLVLPVCFVVGALVDLVSVWRQSGAGERGD